TDAAGATTTTAYDSNGNVSAVTDPLLRTATFHNDALGRTTQTDQPDGSHLYSDYDSARQLTASVDQGGVETDYFYDSRGQQARTVEGEGLPLERSTLASFDAAGRQVQSRDVRGYTTAFGYDPVGRQTATTDSLLHVSKSAFNRAGEVVASYDNLGHARKY